MRIMQINSVPYGSTGRIMFAIAGQARRMGHTVFCTTGFSWHKADQPHYFLTSGIVEKELHTVLAKCTGYNGYFSHHATRRLLRFMDSYRPDVIHLHNLHGWYLNLPMLFHYIKANRIPVVWTLHDCWAFTGQCAHFAYAGCGRWREGCGHCPQLNRYPQSYVDRTEFLLREKRELFSGVERMTIVTPSQWLAGMAGQSFLGEYPIRVIPNGIDLDTFRPRERSDLSFDTGGKKLILGVSLGWDQRKGLDVFTELADRLGPAYQIVLVGTDRETDRSLPEGIISIHRTHDRRELAELYSAADVFVNPTREDTFPTVNLEALACGTPVITFENGGSAECLDESCGCAVPPEDIAALQREILRVCTTSPYSRAACRERAKGFDADEQFKKYIGLYASLPD